ncbi:hypothetical protein N7539_008886 [Penicillium diatomitis]|uniref:Uncharacterized protein n=1 Tax=Penicillium diatomitis TaxID=2819901 RepID=A0A9X0BJC9_9EURO|nr:uncharacterized protein N7539_008886 [Penicillium diatomitis]KAJ5469268.1 hypothetical protein N7539_008886 [Penicillium diatomitis]
MSGFIPSDRKEDKRAKDNVAKHEARAMTSRSSLGSQDVLLRSAKDWHVEENRVSKDAGRPAHKERGNSRWGREEVNLRQFE